MRFRINWDILGKSVAFLVATIGMVVFTIVFLVEGIFPTNNTIVRLYVFAAIEYVFLLRRDYKSMRDIGIIGAIIFALLTVFNP